MPVAPSPITIRCLSCGWKKTTIPVSDVMTREEIPALCPVCSKEKLEIGTASFLERAIAFAQKYAAYLLRDPQKK